MRYTISLAATSLLAASTGMAQPPTVVTDIPPIHSLVAMVMGDAGAPVLLLDRGGDAHDFQMRPSQAQAVAGADLVVWMGAGMSPWLGRALDGTAAGGAQVDLLAADVTERRAFGDKGREDHAAADGRDDHDHTGTDPHAWLDPHNAGAWIDLIAAELSRLNPADAATYAANATAARARIAAADARAAAQLDPVKHRPFMVFHDAYGYYAAHFGLAIAGEIAAGDAASPGAARLRALSDAAAGKEDLCVFPEANHDAGLAAQLAETAQARLGPPLDPEGTTLPPGPDLYPALITGLATAIAGCLGAGG